MASTVVAVGLTIAAAGFAGCYVLHVEPQVKQIFRLPKSAFSGGYYRGIRGKERWEVIKLEMIKMARHSGSHL
uniref:Uncharacterized protein n=1 Tax=Gorilla gorilla gorilla TaxID=9595 RepID=A0A2I2Z7V4_GORGO